MTRLHGAAAQRGLLVVALIVQLVVLYAPTAGSAGPFPHSDKVLHSVVFLAPTVLAVLVTRRPWLVAVVFAAHAVVSEVVQGTVLPLRAGDPVDAVADLVGVVLGVTAGVVLVRRRAAFRRG